MLHLLLILALGAQTPPVVIDRLAVVVGSTPIKTSDIDRELRVTAFLNGEPLVLTADAKRKTAERLVDQAIIRNEIVTGGFDRATYADATAMMDSLRRDRYGNSEPRFREALAAYGLPEPALHDALQWQLTVLRFIDERFRPGILVTDEEIKKYYDEHFAELRRQHPKNSSFEALAPTIRNSLEGERVNTEFEAWLQDARKRVPVDYKQGAFQ